jgi:hypothetical protein
LGVNKDGGLPDFEQDFRTSRMQPKPACYRSANRDIAVEMSSREIAIDLIERLPENISVRDIARELSSSPGCGKALNSLSTGKE